MSRTYNDYHFEKLDILDTLDKIEMSVKFLYLWVQEPMGLENAKYVLEKNANRKFDWFDIHMVRDIANEELN